MEIATYLLLCALLLAVFFGTFALGQWIAAGLREGRRSHSRIARRLDHAHHTVPDQPV